MLLQTPPIVELSETVVKEIVKRAGVTCDIVQIGPPNAWIMQSQKIILEDGRTLLLKLGVEDNWTKPESIMNQVNVANLLREQLFFAQPRILSFSVSTEECGYLYILSEGFTGEKLAGLYERSDSTRRQQLFRELGRTYSRIHSIRSDWSGIWAGSLDQPLYPIHPAQFYWQSEITGGSGKYLLEHGMLDMELYDNICGLWRDNLPFLMNRPSSLIHISPFPWSIYLQNDQVEGFAALGDFMWWDSMSDVAHLLYPPFMDITDVERQAFLAGYENPVDQQAIRLYVLLNRLCAMANCYFAPVGQASAAQWIARQTAFLRSLVDSCSLNV